MSAAPGHAPARARVHRLWDVLVPRWPDSLFGRLAVLLTVVAIASHALALSLLFELRPMGPGPHHEPPPLHAGVGAPEPGKSLAPPGPPGPALTGMLLDIGVRLGAVLWAAWIGARWLSAPLRRLARSTQELATNIHRPPLVPEGTRECREASGVINQLQQHILAQLEERDRFVAAVSHDLRTPLTRLALRAESLGSEVERRRFGKDIQEMDLMIRATLDHLCGAAEAEATVTLDLGSLVETLVADRQACDEPVGLCPAMRPQAPAPSARVQVSALRRAIGNLIDNAVFYGGSAEVGVSEDAQSARVTVSDRGPGIPDAALEQVLKPFVRLEGSRNRNTGGLGLGLSVVNDIARRHGGHVVLSNRPGGGLRAELVLPRTAARA